MWFIITRLGIGLLLGMLCPQLIILIPIVWLLFELVVNGRLFLREDVNEQFLLFIGGLIGLALTLAYPLAG